MSRQEVSRRGGINLFVYYSSLAEALQTAFPEYNWEPFKFARASSSVADMNFWDARENRRALMDFIGQDLGIRQVKFSVIDVVI